MSIIWENAVLAAAQTAKLNQVGDGGKVKVGTLGYDGAGTGVLLAIFTLGTPNGTVVDGVWTITTGAGLTTVGEAGAGTGLVPATAIVTDASDVRKGRGLSVGVHVEDVEDPDIVLDSPLIVAGQNVTLLSLSFVYGNA